MTQWIRNLAPDNVLAQADLLTPDRTPLTRVETWGNAAPQPGPLTPNLLAEHPARLEGIHEPPAPGDPRPWHGKIETLTDGDPSPPDEPWLHWTDVNYIDSGWRKGFTFQIDTFRTQLKLTGITLVEDPAHPESWQRDLRLQSWDPVAEVWRNGPCLLSNAATHTHWFEQPIEAAKFRFVTTGRDDWPANNLRWGELVFHGESLGASHPDVQSKRPVAVLFDEQESDLKHMMAYGGRPFAFRYEDAFSGGKCLALTAAGDTAPHFKSPYGHVLPNWDFEIVEKPGPGQYRWLRYAWKALAPETRGLTLHIGAGQAGEIGIVAGEEGRLRIGKTVRQGVQPPREWETVLVDLWAANGGKDLRVRSLALEAVGGGAVYDQILLARDPSDLPSAEGR